MQKLASTEKFTVPIMAALIILPRLIGLNRLALPAETNAAAAILQRVPSAITPAQLFPFRAAEIAVITAVLLLVYRRLQPAGRGWAMAATLLLAWEPIFAAYSRLLLPQPLAAIFLLALVLILPDAFGGDDRTLWLSGILGGLVLATAANLLPVVLGVSLVALWLSRRISAVERWFFWLVAVLVAWLAFSPAAWNSPAEFITSALKMSFAPPTAAPLLTALAVLSPVGLFGLTGVVFRRAETTDRALWLLLTAEIIFGGGWLLFQPDVSSAETLVILLPITVLAARGWWLWLELLSPRRKNTALAMLAAAQLASIGWSAPYLVTFTNPLWGNVPLAAHRVEIPDGVGMDAAAAWLNARPDALDGVVGTDTPELLSPFYAGRLTAFTAPDAAFVVLTRAQQRAEIPSPTILRYYAALMEPEFSAVVRGQTMAQIYRAPVVQRAMDLPRGLDTGILPKPIAFRLNTVSPRRGEPLTVDVIWLTDPAMPPTQSVLGVRTLIQFEADMVEAEDIPVPETEIFVEAAAPLQTISAGLVVSRHRLRLPADLPSGQYSLVADGRPIGVLNLLP